MEGSREKTRGFRNSFPTAAQDGRRGNTLSGVPGVDSGLRHPENTPQRGRSPSSPPVKSRRQLPTLRLRAPARRRPLASIWAADPITYTLDPRRSWVTILPAHGARTTLRCGKGYGSAGRPAMNPALYLPPFRQRALLNRGAAVRADFPLLTS